MKVHQLPVGQMQNFCYVVSDEETGKCAVIDPSWDLDTVMETVTRNGLSAEYVINTHHHFDHTVGNEAIAGRTGARIIQHEESELKHDITVRDGSEIRIGSTMLSVLHTPGHSRDSICLVGDGKIFTGDTLFVGSCGRVDLPGGSARDLYGSIFGVLYRLDDSLVVYCGHDYGTSPVSTLGDEKKSNPVMRRVGEEQFVAMMGG
ncbi:Zn-dependent hydrolase [Cenarchaeum symbiosum A]|uniref:Zn-dependent hydrolase n=1 Tax=Cenarchaeum symbiosum (strain A) TaxID=414004 RepID=A0RY05_CENSY|nr:Zn-dependent hydrolase [Cenarchaeum symbiosum A]